MLMKKIQPQCQLSEIQPPRIGPKTGATTTVIAHNAKANVRFSGGYDAINKLCDSGINGPATKPCNTLKITKA